MILVNKITRLLKKLLI